MTPRSTRAHLPSGQATVRSPWRMDPPAPSSLQNLVAGALPGAVVAMVMLGLLLAFGSVVSDGVRRGEQLRSQFASVAPTCDQLTADQRHQACPDGAEASAATVARLPSPPRTDGPVLVVYRR